MFQRQVGIHPLEPGQLGLDVLQVPQLRHLHAGVLVLPDVVRRLADAVLAARLGHLRAGLDLLEDPDDLFLAELRLLHAELLRCGNSTSDWLESTRTLHSGCKKRGSWKLPSRSIRCHLEDLVYEAAPEPIHQPPSSASSSLSGWHARPARSARSGCLSCAQRMPRLDIDPGTKRSRSECEAYPTH